jgi:hypothetical protein
MTVYTYSQARQHFSDVLLRAGKDGEVLIKRQDGSLFSLRRAEIKRSPLNVPAVRTTISRQEIVEAVRESRAGRA